MSPGIKPTQRRYDNPNRASGKVISTALAKRFQETRKIVPSGEWYKGEWIQVRSMVGWTDAYKLIASEGTTIGR